MATSTYTRLTVVRDHGSTSEVSGEIDDGDQLILNPPSDNEGRLVNAEPVTTPNG
jgi:hypothetical protein